MKQLWPLKAKERSKPLESVYAQCHLRGEMRQHTGKEGDNKAHTNENDSNGMGKPFAGRNNLFEKNESADCGHPTDMHNAHDKENHHESPAAAEAVEAVGRTHSKRANPAIMPMFHHEMERALAMLQTGLLQSAPLVQTGNN